MYRNGYTRRMAKNLLPLDALVADYLSDGVRKSGLTYRQLSAATGMSINRIGIILRHEPPPATVGEISTLARALGLTASALVERAESADDESQCHLVDPPVRADFDLVANETISEYRSATDADFDNA